MMTPTKGDLDAVFIGKASPPPMGDEPGPPPTEMMPPEDHSDETEAALDDAIDELFSTDDPAARRDAFKRALRLCEQSEGGGGY